MNSLGHPSSTGPSPTPRPTPVPLPAAGHRRRLAGLLVALSLLAAACISDDPELDATGDDGAAADEQTDGAEDGGDGTQTDGGDGEGEGTGDGEGAGADLPVGAVADPASLASIEASPCAFDEPIPLPVDPVCHTISVPEDWDDPDPDDQVVLQVAVFGGDDPDASPTIYFDGGPGGNTLDTVSFSYGRLIEPFLTRGDHIVFDQRGVGLSEPSLACPEVVEAQRAAIAENPSIDEEADRALAAYLACRDRLVSGGVDLEQYHSIASANDVEAIRALLDYEQLNVIGISYGTRLAQTYMRLHPDSVRSVVLDSVFPTEADLWSNFGPGARRAFDQMFAGCAASPSCAETYPDFEDRYFELVAAMDDEPIEVELTDLFGRPSQTGRYDGTDLMGLTFSALYDRGRFASIPELVEATFDGDTSLLAALGSLQVGNLDFITDGVQISVECNEEIPFESEAELEANRSTDPRYAPLDPAAGGLTLFDICAQWPAGQAPPVEDELVESDIPTLLFGGQYDPITPPAGMAVIEAGLTNATSFLFPHDGHGLVPVACGAEIVLEFLADPDEAPDGSCVDATAAPVWAPGAESVDIEFEPFESTGLVAISGVRPTGWQDVGNGVFARQRTSLDPTALIIQPTAGLDPDALVSLLGTQLGVELEAADDLTVDGRVWRQFRGEIDARSAARVTIAEDDGVLVALVAGPDEIDALFDQVFAPVASAATPG